MLLAEPPPSRFDVHFSVGKIPIRIHPLFWLITALFGAMGDRGLPSLSRIALWMTAVLISILVHELGHAWMAQHHGWPPRITLYGMGGVASYRPSRGTTKSKILISAAGPGAGFALGLLVLFAILATGHSFSFFGLFEVGGGPLFSTGGGRLNMFVMYLMYVNIFWGMINLMPIQPLDGGSIAYALLAKRNPNNGLEQSLKLSIGTAIVLAVAGFSFLGPFAIIMFGYLGWMNYQSLQRLRGM